MNEEQRLPASQVMQNVSARDALDQQIAEQDATIRRIEHRLAAPLDSQRSFALAEFHGTMSLEAELSTARERRGQLIYDRTFARRSELH